MIQKIKCDYCSKDAFMVTGKTIYPKRTDLHGKFFYMCKPCDAYVGVHANTNKPFGRLADKELRRWKMAAHSAFDPIWEEGKMQRKEAYAWLAGRLGFQVEDTHIGYFDINLCKKVIEICKD